MMDELEVFTSIETLDERSHNKKTALYNGWNKVEEGQIRSDKMKKKNQIL